MNRRITAAQIRLVLKKVGLDPDLKKAVAKYSLGMRQRLGIAQAIMEDPDLLILDEPFNGLDKHGVEEIRKILLELKKEGKVFFWQVTMQKISESSVTGFLRWTEEF